MPDRNGFNGIQRLAQRISPSPLVRHYGNRWGTLADNSEVLLLGYPRVHHFRQVRDASIAALEGLCRED